MTGKSVKKTIWKGGTMIYPLPTPMITCGDIDGEYNIITIAWTGIISTEPPRCYISVRPKRYSHKMIKENGEFIINLTTNELAFATDWCGVKSGKDTDKFKEMKLTPQRAIDVKPPLIAESPINLECRVFDVLNMGSHDMFMADILRIHADEEYIDKKTGAFNLNKAAPICYSHGKYYTIDKFVGKFGFSVKKKRKKRRRKK